MSKLLLNAAALGMLRRAEQEIREIGIWYDRRVEMEPIAQQIRAILALEALRDEHLPNIEASLRGCIPGKPTGRAPAIGKPQEKMGGFKIVPGGKGAAPDADDKPGGGGPAAA